MARSSRALTWKYDVNPFGHIQGQKNHLEQVDSNCFPTQSLVTVSIVFTCEEKSNLRWEKGRPYSWKEVDDMITAPEDEPVEDKAHKNGMLVFGNKQSETKLGQLAEANLQENLQPGGHRRCAQPSNLRGLPLRLGAIS